MNPGDDVQLIEDEAAAARVRIYGFLAGVFCSAPTAESAHAVSQMALTLGISCPEGLSLGELEREFMDLFVVPNPRYVAPYESVYRDCWVLPPGPGRESTEQVIGRLLMGESTLQVRQAYLRAGVLPQEDLPDHIANELRFMAYLWESEADADGEGPASADLRQRFCREHLLRWIGPLHERVAERDRIGFYRAALEVTEAVLRDDAAGDGGQAPPVPSDPLPRGDVTPRLSLVEGTWASPPSECGPRGCPISGMGAGGHPVRRV